MTSTTVPSIRLPKAQRSSQASVSSSVRAGRHLAWLACGAVISFLVPFVLADSLGLQKDVYYGIYGLTVIGLFAAWANDTGQSLRKLCERRWRLAVALGIVFAGIGALIVLGSEDAGTHKNGVELIGALLWRGVAYGAIDGLLLSAFPILVVFAAFAGSRLINRRGGRALVAAIAMAASLGITATYHLGYSDFRSEKVRKPMTGALVWGVPTLVTLNPVGAPIAHVGVHVAAVSYNPDTDLFLPPH